jgi:GntR family transcriptional regulator, transcriptional repressor for pyruvate dehydrogenase complex
MTGAQKAASGAGAPRRRSRSLAQEVVEDLTGQIREGVLRQGDKLPTESELMRQQGVSRTVVREAISRLQAAGVVETRHGIGSFVLGLPNGQSFHIDPTDLVTIHDLLNVLQLRQSLETAAAGIAALHRTQDDLDALSAILREFRQHLDTGRDTVDLDFRFHLAIARATGNRYFVEFMSYLDQTVIPRTRINTASLGKETQQRYLKRVHDEHEAIYKAIELQNPQAASSVMQAHLNNSAERLRSTLKH